MKKLIALLMTLTLLFSMLAVPALADEQVTLNLWGLLDDKSRYDPIVEAYEKLHPEVKIEMTLYSSSELEQALTTALAGREPMDILISNGTQYMEGRYSTGMISPLNDLIESTGFDTSIFGEAFPTTAIDGQYWGIPYRDSVAVVVYNKTYFDQRGVEYPNADTTWEGLLDIAEKMTWGEGPDKVWGLFNAARNTDWNGMAFHNGVYSTSEDLTLLAKAMEWKLDAIKRGVMMDNASYTAFGTGIRAMFASGKSSMYFGGDWTIGQLNGDYKKGVFDFEWDVAPMPKMEDGTGRMCTMGQYIMASIVSYSEKKEAAFDFITFLCGHDGALIAAEDGMLSAAKVYDDVKAAFMKSNEETGMPKNIGLYFELNGVQAPPVKGYGQTETLVKQEADMVFSGMESVDDAIQNILNGRQAFMN